MSDISPSVIQTNAALEEQLKSAGNVEQIKEILRAEAVKQGHVVPDAFDNRILLPVEQPAMPAPLKFATTVTLSTGEKKIFEADSELELQKAQTAFFREQMLPNKPSDTVQSSAQPRDGAGKFVSAEDSAARAGLDLEFKRGSITTEEYLKRSGAIDSYLESRGISLPELQQVAQQNYASEWKSATDQFLARHPDWEGGDANLQEAGRTLERLNLLGAPTVESLEAAYQDMRRRNAIAKNPELEKQRELRSRLENATSYSEIQNATSLFGRR